MHTDVDTLIIGFGLTPIPLIRELEAEGRNFKVISSGPSVWERLAEAGRLDFDLVSGYMSSVYSFEFAQSDEALSRFPTASEFRDFIRRYQDRYRSHVVEDWVDLIENHEDHSLVHTRSGEIYRARHLVVATAFRRKVHRSICTFDFDNAGDKTVVLTTIGDSANLIVSKLVPQGTRVIVLSEGFFALDKMVMHGGKPFALEELEMHEIGNLSGNLYKMTVPQGQPPAYKFPALGRTFMGSNFYARHPDALRRFDLTPSLDIARGSPFSKSIPNGTKILKYWPIDTYRDRFGDDLENSIRRGYLLNDIAYFVDQGLVELWPRGEASLDRDNRVLHWNGETIRYDHIVDGDQEVPNLPAIRIKRPGQPDRDYQYDYRDCYLGLMPRDLPGTYLLGYTRPMTGGLNNIAEMQCLLLHRMLTDEAFCEEVQSSLGDRIDTYNESHYATAVRRGGDNLVFYGQYNEEIAHLLGIKSRLRDCRSLEDAWIHFLFPNAPIKFRRRGPYQIEGADEKVREVYRAHDRFSVLKQQLLNYTLIVATAMLVVVLAHTSSAVSIPRLGLVVGLAFCVLNPVFSMVHANANRLCGWTNLLLLAGLGASIAFPNPLVPLASLVAFFAVVYWGRKAGITRVFFNDVGFRDKPEFHAFFDRYREVYARVKQRPSKPNPGPAVNSRSRAGDEAGVC